jgi:UDP-GlcNAc3NAcA epimerase
VEIVEAGAGVIADADYQRILAAYRALAGKQVNFPPLFGDAHASEKILQEILDYLG